MCCFLSLALFVILHSLHFWKSKLERCFYQSEWAIRPIERVLFLVSFSQGKNRKGKERKKKTSLNDPDLTQISRLAAFIAGKAQHSCNSHDQTCHSLGQKKHLTDYTTPGFLWLFFRCTFYKRKKKEKNLKTSALLNEDNLNWRQQSENAVLCVCMFFSVSVHDNKIYHHHTKENTHKHIKRDKSVKY